MHRRLASLASMLLLGCGSADAVCTVGEALACSCPDGREGITECDGLGQPGACVCDQVGPEAAAWSRRLGDEREQSLIALAPTGDGIVVVGAFEGVLEVGGVPLVSAGSRDIFVASFGPGGAHRWSRSYGGPGDDFARAVAVDAEGSIYVAGGFSDEIRIVADDPIVLTAEGETDAFVMRLRASGETRWARSWGSLGLDAFTRVTLVEGATQNVLYLGGYYQLTLTYEGGVLAPSGGTDVMVARLSEEDGSPVFFAHIGGGGNDAVGGIATNGADFYVAGGYQGFDMGLPNSPEGNAFVFGFDATGTPQNSSYFRGAGRDDARDAAIAGGQLWIAGRFEDQLEPLATPETIEAVGGQDIFLTPLWAVLSVWCRRSATRVARRSRASPAMATRSSWRAASTAASTSASARCRPWVAGTATSFASRAPRAHRSSRRSSRPPALLRSRAQPSTPRPIVGGSRDASTARSRSETTPW